MLCRCGHDKDWHAEGGTADCEHNAECPCEKFDPAPVAASVCNHPLSATCRECAWRLFLYHAHRTGAVVRTAIWRPNV